MDGGEKLSLKGKALVANTGEDTLTFIDFDDGKIESIDLKAIPHVNYNKTIGLKGEPIGPYDLVSNQGYIYCTNIYDHSVFKLDLKNRILIDTLAVGSCPTCIKHFNDYLFIANTDSNSISIIEEDTFTLAENIPVGEKPTHIEIDEINNDIYVVNSNGYSMDIINLNSRGHRTIKLKNNPVKVSILQNKIYILSNINNGLINSSNISIVNLESYKEEDRMEMEGILSNMLKINDREIIFSTSMEDGCLYRVDIEKKNLLSKTYLEGMPNQIEWNRGQILYITNISTNRLTLFHMDRNRVIKNIEVGKEPNGILLLN